MRPTRTLARLTPFVAALVAGLAACHDGADPTAPVGRPALAAAGSDGPRTTAPPPTPSLTVVVTLHVGDQAAYGGPAGVPGTKVTFATNGGYSQYVADNSPADFDARVGYYRVWMPNATSYTATVRVMPEHFSTLGASKTVAATVTPTTVTPTVVPMGSIVLKRKPGLHVRLMMDGALVPGQTIGVTGPAGFTVVIADGGYFDRDAFGNPSPSDGRIYLRLPVTGTYTVCARTTPILFYAARCQEVVAEQYFFAYAATLTYYPPSLGPTL
jgi:hypothetical protein